MPHRRILLLGAGDLTEGENVGYARRLGLPVVIGRGADPSLLRRLSLEHAIAFAAVTADDLQNIKVALAAHAEARDLRVVLRADGNATGGETRSLERLGHVRDAHRIGAVYVAGLALGSAVARTWTVPRTFAPSAGASIVTTGAGTAVSRAPLERVWPRLSSTTARYFSGVPVGSSDTSWKTR
jgi:Trk K+ transport system NAD-binding subunit